MAKRKIDENVREDGSTIVNGKKRGGIIAFIICVLIALAIWTYAENVEIINENTPEGEGQTAESYTEGAGE